MLLKRFDSPIVQKDLQWLIESELPEGKTIEYKRQAPDPNDSGKVKFLKTVTAFANTDGGDLIIGIEADQGIAKKLCPIDRDAVDAILQRLESTIASSTEPRLSGVSLQQVPLEMGGSAIVVRVRRSWNSPHRVIVGNHAHFYGRNSAGCYSMDTSELRRAFTMADGFSERAKEFRKGRFAEYNAKRYPFDMEDRAKVAIHIMPLQSLITDREVQLFDQRELIRKLSPPQSNNYDGKYNLNGWISYDRTPTGKVSAYAQLYRNGIVEGLFCPAVANSNEKFLHPWYEEIVVEFLEKSSNFLLELDVTPPVYIGISLLDVFGHSLITHNRVSAGHPITEATSFGIPETQVDDIHQHPSIYMKDAFDSICNAFGYARSSNYNSAGIWSPPL